MRNTFHKGALQWVLLSVVFLQLALMVISLPTQSCHIDEAWMGEQVWWERKDGIPRQELLSGMFHLEERMLIRHKLHIFLGSLITRAVGFHLPALRLIPLISGLALLGMMFLYTRRLRERWGEVFLYSAAVFLLCPLVFRYIKVFRPEFLLTALGFASFLLILRALERERLYSALAAGAVAGLGVLAHLNGVIFIAAGLGVLLFRRKWWMTFAFVLGSVAVSSLYFYDIVGSYPLFREQFFNDFVVERTDYGILAPLLKLLNEHGRYFRKPEIIGISALFVLLLPLVFRSGRERDGVLVLYLSLLMVSLGLVSKSITTKYAIPVLPFFALVIGTILPQVFESAEGRGRLYRWLFMVMLTAYVGYGIYDSLKIARTGGNPAEKNALVAQNLVKGSRVLAPARFIFNEIGNFTIRDLYAARYLIMKGEGKPFNLTTLCDYARENRFEYILLDREYSNFGNIDPRKVFAPVWGYAVIKTFNDGAILMQRSAFQFDPRS